MMKHLFSLILLCVVLAITSCSKDDNNNSVNAPALSFKEKAMKVFENIGTVKVPLNLSAPVSTKTTIYVSIKESSITGAQEGVPFASVTSPVVLEKGSSEGFISLQIVDNKQANTNCSFDLEITKVEGDAQIEPNATTCKITIVGTSRTVRFETVEPGAESPWHEEAGLLEIPLIFENGTSSEDMISGKITAEASDGCTASDFELETTEFSTAGNETLKIKLKVKDNDTFGDWKIRLTLKDLKGVRAASEEYIINVKDDERILGFKEMTYSVDEGKNLEIVPFLYGGNAATRIPLTIEVVQESTTALPTQYSLPTTINPMYAATSSSPFVLSTYKHPSRQDKVLTLKITTTVGATSPNKILTDNTQICKVTIKNTDSFVGFANETVSNMTVGVNNIPIIASGYNEDVMVYVEIKSSTMNTEYYELTNQTIRIPANAKNANIQIKLLKAMKKEDTITLEITRIVFVSSGEANEEIDPDAITCICKPQN